MAHVPSAGASTITFFSSISFGEVTPDGPAPYATSVFDDGDTPGTVTLTISVAGTVGIADVTEFYYNLDPNLDPTALSIVRTGGTGPTAANTTISTGVDGFKADGDGFFDIYFDFPPPPGNDSAKFNAGETLVYAISGIPSLVASSFDYFSAPGGGQGPYTTAAHFQSTGDGSKSDWVGSGPGEGPIVPEPASALLVLVGLLAACGPFARRRVR